MACMYCGITADEDVHARVCVLCGVAYFKEQVTGGYCTDPLAIAVS